MFFLESAETTFFVLGITVPSAPFVSRITFIFHILPSFSLGFFSSYIPSSLYSNHLVFLYLAPVLISDSYLLLDAPLIDQ